MRITRKGYYEVYDPDGNYISRHTSRDESYEAITEHGHEGVYTISCPNREVEMLLGIVNQELGGGGSPPVGGGYTPTHYVTTTGSATWANATSPSTPASLATAMSDAVAGNVVQVGPGTYTGTNTGARDVPAWTPANSGTSGSPIIFFAEFPASINATSRSQLQHDYLEVPIADTPQGGPSFGTSYNIDYIIFDGFYTTEAVSSPHRDTGPVVAFGAQGVEFRRCVIEGQDVTYADNHPGIRFNDAVDCAARDCKISGFTRASPNNNSSGIQTYYTRRSVFEHNEIDDCGTGVYLKGASGDAGYNSGIIVRKNLITNSKSAFDLLTTSGVIEGYGADIYQNIAVNCNDGILYQFWGDAPRDIRLVNNLFYNITSVGLRFQNSANFSGNVCRNNIVTGAANAVEFLNATTTGTDIDDTLYFSNTQWYYIATAYSTLANWVTATPWDDSSADADPAFVNAAGGDYTLDTGSPALDAGLDYLNLLGGGTGASINYGPYVSAGQTEEIGVRASPSY